MGALDARGSLARISIPGTHDSGARREVFPGITTCQTLTIAEQLAAGVRYLDIRCRHARNSFEIYHGPVHQRISFADVLNDCVHFLNDNSSECVIMSVKEEYMPLRNARSFERTFDAYAANDPDRWLLTGAVPTLGEASGKIVLLRRFKAASAPKGIDATDWPVNATFAIGGSLARIRVQDEYIVRNNRDKWTAVQELHEEARSGKDDTLYLNFTSGYRPGLFGFPNIPAVSNFINPAMAEYFTNNKSGAFGITVMDFADERTCALIVGANF
ncbi:MAG: phosphatidylinositol-specific phospholipase C [Candidatus Binataceae bacterium]